MAIPGASGGVRQRGRVLLARVYARDPDWVGQAEELLLSVLQDEPGNTDVPFYLRGGLGKAPSGAGG